MILVVDITVKYVTRKSREIIEAHLTIWNHSQWGRRNAEVFGRYQLMSLSNLQYNLTEISATGEPCERVRWN